MSDTRYRPFQPSDLERLRAIMLDSFEGVSIDQGMEREFGPINGRDWRWRKARHLDDDFAMDPDGMIVAEIDGQPIGFISTWLDREAGIGNIPNISVDKKYRGQGIGRKLIELALDRFRQAGLSHAKIETLAHNEIGNHLYPSCGFREVARQIHFLADLSDLSDSAQDDAND